LHGKPNLPRMETWRARFVLQHSLPRKSARNRRVGLSGGFPLGACRR
jgi:hypothetical protein